MHATHTNWWDLGYYGLFACVFLEQIGVPIPAFPALLAAGALVASGEMSLPMCLLVAMVAALMADIIWYSIGRSKGGSVLNLLCRLSWKPDSCVSKTKTVFSQHGTKTLLISKFVPGLSTLAPPLAGITQVPFGRFLAYDSIGTIIWATLPLLAGAYVQESFRALQTHADSVKAYLPWVCGALILGVATWRYLNRYFSQRRLERSLDDAVSVDDLKQRIEQGEDLIVIDVRHELDAAVKPFLLPTAQWIPYTVLPEKMKDLHLEKPIIVYCDCPKDEGAVAMADMLREGGAALVLPLRGGLAAWLAKGFATDPLPVPALISLKVPA